MPQISTSDVLETLRTVGGSHINRDPQDHRLYLYLPDGQILGPIPEQMLDDMLEQRLIKRVAPNKYELA